MRFRWALIIVWLFLWLGLPAAGQGDALSYRLREPDSTFMQVCREDKAFQYVVPDESSDWLENALVAGVPSPVYARAGNSRGDGEEGIGCIGRFVDRFPAL